MPFARFEWMLAGRYLRPTRKEGFVSVIAGFSFLGIMLGVATLIIVMSVMNGFRAELLGRILGLNGHILVQAAGPSLVNFDPLAQAIEKIPGVRSAVPLVEGQVLASSNNGSTGALVRGLRKADIERLTVVANGIKQGSLENFGQTDGIVIGARLADNLGLHVGDAITILTPDGPASPFGTLPRMKTYPVLATFAIGMSEYDAAFMFLPLEEAQAFFNIENGVSVIEVMVDDADAVGRYQSEIAGLIQGSPARIITWKDRDSSFFGALEVERNVMFLILTLIILVAALNIISGLIMLVKDKAQAIAILRTMGATQGAVMRIFFITGASIGVSGTLAGLVLGVVFCDNIEAIRQFLMRALNVVIFPPDVYFLTRLPAQTDVAEVTAVVLIALVLTFLATLYPSWRAARLDPVDALRYE